MAELEKDGRTEARTEEKTESGANAQTRRGANEAEWQDLEKIWSRKRALRGLMKIFALSLEGARVEIRDEDGAVVDIKYNPSMANAATRAAEAANKMLGYIGPPDAEDDGADDGAIFVDFGDGEDYAG